MNYRPSTLNFLNKFLAVLLLISINIIYLLNPILVLAQEASASAEIEETIDPSPTPTQEPSETAQPSPSATISPDPTASPSATPSIEPISSPSAEPTAQPSDSEVNRSDKQNKLNKVASKSEKKQKKINKQKNYVEGEVLVKYKTDKINLKKDHNRNVADNIASKSKSRITKEIKQSNIVVLESTDNSTEQLINEIKNDPNVETVEPNYIRQLTYTPNDSEFNQQWSLLNTINNGADIKATSAWDLEKNSQPDVVVAVIDSGVAYDHPDLATNMWNGSNCKDNNGNLVSGGCPNHGWDYVGDDNDPYDENGHGTHVSGIIAASSGNNVGISGISSNNHIKIMVLRAGDSQGYLYGDAIIQAINFAKYNGAKVINASFGGGPYSQLEKDTIANFPGLFIASAGNGGFDFKGDNNDNSYVYPASYDNSNIIAVASTTNTDQLSSFSNYGATTVDIGAPGSGIYSTYFEWQWDYQTVYSQDFQNITPSDVTSDFTKTGDWGTGSDSGWFSQVSAGPPQYVLYGDINKPYKPNANSTITSKSFDLSGKTDVELHFFTRCDTEYKANYTDYMQLKYSTDGNNFSEYTKWDEQDLDIMNDESPHNSDGYAEGSVYASIPQEYYNSNFKFQFRWVTNGSDSGSYGKGCMIDDIRLISYNGLKLLLLMDLCQALPWLLHM